MTERTGGAAAHDWPVGRTEDTEPDALIAQARDWVRQDPDERHRAVLTEEIDAALDGDPPARASLLSRFAGPLAFGTAGLRAPEGPGPARMNRSVVRRTAAGLARYLTDRLATDRLAAGRPRLVVGYDARHGSAGFAHDSAAVFTAAGLDTVLLPEPLPTPVLAFAVRHLDADAGVMVTASHNPPQDNGYKVYLGGRMADEHGRGAQIVAPADAEIAARIDHAEPIASIALAEAGWTVAGDELLEAYRHAALQVLHQPRQPDDGADSPEATDGTAEGATDDAGNRTPAAGAPPARAGLRIVYTPLHGVGGAVVPELLGRAGFTDVVTVPEQAEPDPEFPTVDFPNPEEPGALTLALAAAERVSADLVIANDPDADRCALAVPDPAGGRWRMLRGDETGVLLGSALLPALAGSGTVAANSVVSGRLLGRMAEAAGVGHRMTLTGFKWIARVPQLGYGYEEALGYCVAPETVRDKDGMTAALVAAALAASLKAQGRSLTDRLEEIALEHGLMVTGQVSVRVSDLRLLDAMMSRLRATPLAQLDGRDVVESADLADGYRGLPATEGLLFLTDDDSRVIIRPSGTEPKLKCYLEVVRQVDQAVSLPAARREAAEAMDGLVASVSDALGR